MTLEFEAPEPGRGNRRAGGFHGDETREDRLPARPGEFAGDADEAAGGDGGDAGSGGNGRENRRGNRRPRWARITWLVILGLLAFTLLTPLTVAWRVWYQARQDETPRSDAIIVLGAAQYNGRPSPTLQWRLQHALDLYRHGRAKAIVTVGGRQEGDNFTEAEAGKRWLVQRGGVPASRVVAVPIGNDTLESMRAVGREYDRLGWKSGIIVTDPWHGLRSKRMASDSGIDAAASPTRSGPSVQTRETQLQYIVRETGGYLSYVLFGKSVRAPSETIKTVPSQTGSP